MNIFYAISILAIVSFAARSLWIVTRPGPIVELRDEPDQPSLSIVVPARNEARNIERCVRSLLAQRHGDFELIVVDDRSDDETAAIVRSIAVEDARLRLVEGQPLPDGWVGKPWALTQGAQAARGAWLLFTDADTMHAPDSAASAQGYAREHGLDVLSILTFQETRSTAERVLLPTVLFTIIFAIGSLGAVNDPRNMRTALFNGQYILARREAYDAIGGHGAVRGEIAEDLELARRFKADGRFRTALAAGVDLASTRMYASFRELWDGFVKNFWLGTRDRPTDGVFGTIYLFAISPLGPLLMIVALLRAQWLPALALAAALALLVGTLEFGMRRSRFPAGSGAWFPVALPVLIAIFITSALRFSTGAGVSWRGRRYGGGFP